MYLNFVLHLQSVSAVFSVGQAVVVLLTARTFEASLRHVPQTYDLTSDFYSQATLTFVYCLPHTTIMSLAQATKGDMAYQVRSLVRIPIVAASHTTPRHRSRRMASSHYT